jgi:hypothetical protein
MKLSIRLRNAFEELAPFIIIFLCALLVIIPLTVGPSANYTELGTDHHDLDCLCSQVSKEPSAVKAGEDVAEAVRSGEMDYLGKF